VVSASRTLNTMSKVNTADFDINYNKFLADASTLTVNCQLSIEREFIGVAD